MHRNIKIAANAGKRIARILIVDDHPVVREGLALRISSQPDMEVCGEAADIASALQLVADTKPDVAVVDIALKDGNGIDLIKRIRAHEGSVRILVWSMYNESLYAERALRAGAMGYLNKEQATDRIDVIRRVLEGKICLSDPLAEQLLSRTLGHGAPDLQRSPVETLSDRELEVFRLIGLGLGTQGISDKMRVSPKTVETYRARIKEQLNIASAPGLARRAVQWVVENG
jgi:DNA-binding NarL/FixJ family response regulator